MPFYFFALHRKNDSRLQKVIVRKTRAFVICVDLLLQSLFQPELDCHLRMEAFFVEDVFCSSQSCHLSFPFSSIIGLAMKPV